MNINEFEAEILLFIQNNIRCDFLTPIMEFVSLICEYGILWIVTGLIMLCMKRTRKCGIIVLTALLLSLIVNNAILKNLIMRVRPYDIMNELTYLGIKPNDYSFPSGHTAASFCAAFSIAQNRPPRYGIPALLMAALVAVSRLYLGGHYPTDVAAGIVSGLLLAFAAKWSVTKLYRAETD